MDGFLGCCSVDRSSRVASLAQPRVPSATAATAHHPSSFPAPPLLPRSNQQQHDLYDALYYVRMVAALIMGVVCGVVGLTGLFTFLG